MNRFEKYASQRSSESLPYTVKRHQSLLRRKLGSTDPMLQENKIVNLGLAIGTMEGIVIRPGETFSFWHLIGRTTADKGYLEGLLLSQGEVKTGIGGGLCQLANLLFWLALHTPLEIRERHHHSFDPFPDDRRVLPFGSGASVFYNYIDLRFFNPTPHTFQFKLRLTGEHLKGVVYCDHDLPEAYHIEERNHRFYRDGDKNFRENEIWKRTVNKETGQVIREALIIRNHAEVKYPIP